MEYLYVLNITLIDKFSIVPNSFSIQPNLKTVCLEIFLSRIKYELFISHKL